MSDDNADKLTRLEEEGEIAADYLEELLDIADLDGDIEIDVETAAPRLRSSPTTPTRSTASWATTARSWTPPGADPSGRPDRDR